MQSGEVRHRHALFELGGAYSRARRDGDGNTEVCDQG